MAALRLFQVERTTQQRRSVWVDYDQYTVLAENAEDAKAKAQAHAPQDELDGPTVGWSVKEETVTVVKTRSGRRRNTTEIAGR